MVHLGKFDGLVDSAAATGFDFDLHDSHSYGHINDRALCQVYDRMTNKYATYTVACVGSG